MVRGEEAAFVQVETDRWFHLGGNVSARCAIIGGFGIREPRYRGMGLGGIVLKRTCDLMAEMGYSCSTVGTGTELVAHRLYCQHGYVDRRFPWRYEKRLEDSDAVEKDGKIKVRDYTDSDEAEVRRLREQYNVNTVGPADWSPRSDFGAWIRIAEDAGKIIGYADVYLNPFEPEATINLLHVDVDYPDEEAASNALLMGAHGYALAEGRENISFEDPPMRYRDMILGLGYHVHPDSARYGWVRMFKIVDLPGFLREIAGLLGLRLQGGAHAGWCGSIGIVGSRLTATLVVDSNGKVGVERNSAKNADILITADDETITSLISGNADVWEAYRQHKLTVTPIFSEGIRRLIESLFPTMPCKQGGRW